MLQKRIPNNENQIESSEGQRGLLCSNKVVNRCPSLGKIVPHVFTTIEDELKYLADILVEAYFYLENHEQMEQKSKHEQ